MTMRICEITLDLDEFIGLIFERAEDDELPIIRDTLAEWTHKIQSELDYLREIENVEPDDE